MSNRTVGRPRRDDLTKQLKFNVDDEMAAAVKKIADTTSKSQAEILREIVPIVSSKNFEEMIPAFALEQLQILSDKCWDQLHTPNSIFEVDGLSDNLPAFITSWEPPMVHVKYPTYKVSIYDKNNSVGLTDCNEIEDVLSSVSLRYRSTVNYAPVNYFIPSAGIPQIKQSFVSEVMCLNVNLEENIKTKDSIVTLLEAANYDHSVCTAYCIRSEYVKLLEDGKYFKLIK